ncbi:helix-turn-helix domain-containing protein [Roseomonas fluvialis]|uniref:HTH cro/C1-type domain-containing protein n=1 Tax=Roseomonas fluvialis TaxID=1750527 RepID=A0ABN6P766_9PROT|nr:helix-turn-helix domain-containing protein [Roseomonas fluvialis]BDG73489.1 hypothetical protein Rmf_34180 [Roseomonas fluvialis]
MTDERGTAGDNNIEAHGADWGLVGLPRLGDPAAAWPAPLLEQVEHKPAGTTTVQLPADTDAKAGHVSHPVDIHVGARVRLRRQLLGLNQKELAAMLGLSFQQVQKFERGKDRIAASRLYEIANALNVPISFFFDAIPAEDAGQATSADDLPAAPAGDERLKEALNLMRAYRNVSDPALRKRLLDLVRSMG